MATVKLDLSKSEKAIKPMHAGGQPPVISTARDTYFHYLTEAGIPYSRLHDVGGAFSSNLYVDIPNIFRDFDADENDPASYDFAFTDWLAKILPSLSLWKKHYDNDFKKNIEDGNIDKIINRDSLKSYNKDVICILPYKNINIKSFLAFLIKSTA